MICKNCNAKNKGLEFCCICQEPNPDVLKGVDRWLAKLNKEMNQQADKEQK